MKDIHEIIEAIPLLRGQHWQETTLEGWSNRTVHLQAGEQHYVLRMPLHPLRDGIDRDLEYRHLQAIDTLQIMPPTVYFDRETGVQVREYRAGDVLAHQQLTAPLLQACAQLFRRLHEADIVFEPIDMMDCLYRDRAALLAQAVSLDPRYTALFAYCDRVAGQLICDKKVPCHMDPNGYNFIQGEKLWLIDFEHAHQYDAAWDLAYFITSLRLNPAQEAILHAAYGSESRLRARVNTYKPITQLSQALWVQQQLALGQTAVHAQTLIHWEQETLAYATGSLL